MQGKILLGRRYDQQFSVEELLRLVVPARQSRDVDMDPCKAAAFLGDIAYPEANVTRKRKTRDNFDVRDTISEPRSGRGWGSDLAVNIKLLPSSRLHSSRTILK